MGIDFSDTATIMVITGSGHGKTLANDDNADNDRKIGSTTEKLAEGEQN